MLLAYVEAQTDATGNLQVEIVQPESGTVSEVINDPSKELTRNKRQFGLGGFGIGVGIGGFGIGGPGYGGGFGGGYPGKASVLNKFDEACAIT